MTFSINYLSRITYNPSVTINCFIQYLLIQAIVKLILTGLSMLEQQLNGQDQNQETATTLNLIPTNPQSICTSKLNKTISFALLLSKLFWMMEKTQHTIFLCQKALTIIRVNEIWTNTLLTNQQTEKTKKQNKMKKSIME